MTNATRTLAAAFLCTVSIATSMPQAASALPVNALAIQNAAPAAVEHVQWRGGWGAVGAGLVAGAIIGGALSAPYYGYGPGPYYYPGPYAAPPVVYGAPGAVAGDAVAYCMQRYRSYDPASGTFLG